MMLHRILRYLADRVVLLLIIVKICTFHQLQFVYHVPNNINIINLSLPLLLLLPLSLIPSPSHSLSLSLPLPLSYLFQSQPKRTLHISNTISSPSTTTAQLFYSLPMCTFLIETMMLQQSLQLK